jgi:hypothetical protein
MATWSPVFLLSKYLGVFLFSIHLTVIPYFLPTSLATSAVLGYHCHRQTSALFSPSTDNTQDDALTA